MDTLEAQGLRYIFAALKDTVPHLFHDETDYLSLQDGDRFYSFNNEVVTILYVLKPGVYVLDSQTKPGMPAQIKMAWELALLPLSGAPLSPDDVVMLNAQMDKAAKEFERKIRSQQSKIIT